jgi:hypothetical protein
MGNLLGSEVLKAVIMKGMVLWVVTPCRSSLWVTYRFTGPQATKFIEGPQPCKWLNNKLISVFNLVQIYQSKAFLLLETLVLYTVAYLLKARTVEPEK